MGTVEQHQRFDIVDALRGFALAGILMTHMLEQFIASPRPTEGWYVTNNIIDTIIEGAGFILLNGKFFSIFSLLFGMSFTIMMQRAEQRGHDFSGRFIWRLLLLLVFGVVHTLFYRGDILAVYALIGLLLPLFYKVPLRWLPVIAALIFLGLGRFVFMLVTGKASMLSYELTPESQTVIDYVHTLQTGSLTTVFYENFTNGFSSKFDFQFSTFGRGYVTLGYFLIGLYLVRIGFIRNLQTYRPQIVKALKISGLILALSIAGMITTFSLLAKPLNMNGYGFCLGLTFYDLSNIAMTSIIVCTFLLIYLGRGQQAIASLAPYGRLALSHYLLQSLLGTAIFYGWGLGLLGKLHNWQSLLLACALFVVQLYVSKIWLKHFHFGPLEWAWRSATYFKRVPFKK